GVMFWATVVLVVGLVLYPLPVQLIIQHAGPKLSGYSTSPTTNTTVAQNITPGFVRYVTFQSGRGKSGTLPVRRVYSVAIGWIQEASRCPHTPREGPKLVRQSPTTPCTAGNRGHRTPRGDHP